MVIDDRLKTPGTSGDEPIQFSEYGIRIYELLKNYIVDENGDYLNDNINYDSECECILPMVWHKICSIEESRASALRRAYLFERALVIAACDICSFSGDPKKQFVNWLERATQSKDYFN